MIQLYQNFIVYIDYDDFVPEIINEINYTNYKIVVLHNNEKITYNTFVEPCKIKGNKIDTILQHSQSECPNHIMCCTEMLNKDMLNDLNQEFLCKTRFVANDTIDEKNFKPPIYWSCKIHVLHQIYQQKTEPIEELCLCALDIVRWNQKKIEFFENYDHLEIKTKNMKKRNRLGPMEEKLHLIMATYKRNQYLDKVFSALQDQTFSNIHLHILDNNENKEFQEELDTIIEKSSLTITLHRYNYNYHCISRIFLIKELLKTTYMEYVVIFDDDQIHHKDWIEKMVNHRKPMSILSWYGKIFESCDYWNRKANKDNILTYAHIEYKKKPEINKFKYFGPGGCIFDTNVFFFQECYEFSKYSKDIIKIDDIWMSFLFDKYLHIPFHRLLYHPLECADRNVNEKTWIEVKDEKNDLMKYFNSNFLWNVIKPCKEFYTLNNVFDCVYAIYTNNNTLFKLKKQFLIHNIRAVFIFSENLDTGRIKAFENACSNLYQRILVLNENVIFHKFIFSNFDKAIRKIPKHWDVLYLGTGKKSEQIECNELFKDSNHTYAMGFSAHAFEQLLSYHINNKHVINELTSKTNIRNQFICSPSLITTNSLQTDPTIYYLTNFINVYVNVYVYDITNIPVFNYTNYSIKSLNEISTEHHYVIVDNRKRQFHPDILGKGIYELLRSNMNYCYLNDYELVNNELNNTLKCEFLEPQILKSIGFFRAGYDKRALL